MTRDGDPAAYWLARRHYSAAKNRNPKIRQFIGPGEHLVLISPLEDSVFGWRVCRFRADGQAGIECCLFRNEGPIRSSELILDAEALAWGRWPEEFRMFTYVNPHAVASRNPGYCFMKAGWRKATTVTKQGLILFEKERMA